MYLELWLPDYAVIQGVTGAITRKLGHLISSIWSCGDTHQNLITDVTSNSSPVIVYHIRQEVTQVSVLATKQL